jgi:hypothetical protein
MICARIWRPLIRSADHVLVSRDLNKAVAHVAYRHDFAPAEFCDKTQKVTSSYSDHWPILVQFDLNLMF